ncbi:galactofuranosylgalactofuranosylrhamnosyl-N-acetylglucosaminyl-diphospho-decaprenol beta-1,5/1,6-galactofuranosyltransferase [Leucobacter exalbidus]|uniref:Galactofuranosylgalactofuranosylrhamnosyl-N-acetylglucosaminyl-diphospho-decaprenol beta-1,5/1,6-galactofuranosyltransferase n=1 Tax=Leucobacter exalbidus TaxID=662960 RepID=A0A940PQ68_9MICO|nr:glycosyltransferase [Leucobacter exalbidus]MBP1327130.1 galactofuranosylgalactofuranosylrhamnosyl-N-acetylglucosaminyl-diphospho-decaprenol beta-1,5/1,6-galactofuranosyltransferase [Leucobacter exalbidus]
MPTTLQNVVFPINKDPDVLPLYADAEVWSKIGDKQVRLSQNAHIDNVLSRSSSRVRAGQRVSFASYFNAFPAAYWQRWTVVNAVRLTLRTQGPGTVIVYRSNASGVQQRVDSREVSGSAEHVFDLPLSMFSDGGWYWFDLIASTDDLVLESGAWTTDATPVQTGKLSLGMTTYNKPDYCVSTLENVAADPALLEGIDRIFLVDQGTQKVRDQAGFTEVAAHLGEKLQLIEQGNLGGSGGFSRSMAETLEREDSDFLMLLDDDVEFETESALRGLQFGRFNSEPVIVGGHMFDLLDKPVVHAWAEVVRPEPFMWGPSFEEQHRHDFRKQNLRQTKWMHARLDADYNGWWMCMIPKKIIAEIGLSLPVFIKWDDAEYGLRARAAGYRTVSMPGVALWHVSWLDKDDSQDWQAFFHTRNRIVAGLLHSDRPHGGKLIQNSGRQDIKKLLNMQYYATELAVEGMRSVLRGPHELHKSISKDMPAARARAADYPETRVYKPHDEHTPVAIGGRALPSLEESLESPKGLRLALFTLRMVPKHWRRASAEAEMRAPELEYAKRDAAWWQIPHHSSVIVGAADGSGKMWYRHDRVKFRRLLRESRALSRRIEKNWDRLAAEYRAALPQITSVEEWKKTFEGR